MATFLSSTSATIVCPRERSFLHSSKAARECLLALVLISEDFFTRTKWPMLELAAFVQAQKIRKDLRILPVLLGLTINDLQNIEKWSKSWIEWGIKDKRLTGDVTMEWQDAIEALRPFNMILKSSYDGEVKLRKAIVGCINEMMPPDIRSDVLNVQGRERLCKKVRSMFEETPSTSRLCENATILGGIGGAGKSTLCMIITEYLRSEFLGRVCVVELGKETSTINLQRQVLRHLCRYNEDFLNKHIATEKEGLNRLRERICREPVFLALDNVSDDASLINTAKSFLRLKFHTNSMVLVTSRSDDVLCRSLGIPEGSCMHCPSISKVEALQILLDQVNLPLELLDIEQMQVLNHAVELSFFEGTYHPLALQLFAAQLGTDQSKWREIKLDLEWTSDLEHPLFSNIETNYMRLPDQHTKDMFMDIALFTPECLCGIDDIIWWLNDTINLDGHVDHIKKKLRILRVKSLLEIWKMEDKAFRIHDLYRMLAKRNASVDNVVPRFIYQEGGRVAPKVLLDNDRARIIERAAFVEAKFEMLGLEACTKLQVLSARRCEKLRALCIQRLRCLVSLELAVCPLESLDLRGLSELRWLHVSSCKDLMKLDVSEVVRLRHVNVSECSQLEVLNFKHCLEIKSVSIFYSGLLRYVNMGRGQSLECLTLWFCKSLTDVAISGAAPLTTLKKRGCPRLLDIQGGDIMCRNLQYISLQEWGRLSPTFVRALELSASLQVLDIWNSCMSRLPDLRTCLYLQELRLSDVDVLLYPNNEELLQEYETILCISTEAVELPISLEDIRLECCRNVVVKEIFWKVQGLKNLRLLSLCSVRVGWDWELQRSKDMQHGKHVVLGEARNLAPEEGSCGSIGVIEALSCKEDEAMSEEQVAEVSSLKSGSGQMYTTDYSHQETYQYDLNKKLFSTKETASKMKEKESQSRQMYTTDYSHQKTYDLNKKQFLMKERASKMKRLLVGDCSTKQPDWKLEMERLERTEMKRGSSTKEKLHMEEGPYWKPKMEEPDWKVEMGKPKTEIQAPNPHFREMWDDFNSKLLSLPFSQGTRLHNLCISQCSLTNPRQQLSGEWTCKGTQESTECDEYFQVNSGWMHFRRQC